MVQESTLYWLSGNWQELMDSYPWKVTPVRTREWFGTLMDYYEEDFRWYHNSHHIEHMIDGIWNICVREVGAMVETTSLELAVYFHDAIYDPRRTDNEEASCEFAAKCMYDIGFDAPIVEEVTNLIMVTKTHDPKTQKEMVLSDADLVPLQWPFPKYLHTYAENVRREYEHLSDYEYSCGRIEWLEKMLVKDKIYYSKLLYGKEEQARYNFLQERAYWESRVNGGVVIDV